MAMRLKYHVMADIGKYRPPGQTRDTKVWQKCGVIMVDSNNPKSMTLKLNTLPVGPDWSGWFSIVKPDRDNDQGGHPGG